ncbi:hypothetical protein OWV82_011776 [Melia azedarach]|uniref:Uncharacterized protein n=1 Tax=Melia azedarach TaxID=155640 RepID=A0ACC1XZ56_MELAZ|nr:hypothetical protein OWV82_011776 [Melia azedarach]
MASNCYYPVIFTLFIIFPFTSNLAVEGRHVPVPSFKPITSQAFMLPLPKPKLLLPKPKLPPLPPLVLTPPSPLPPPPQSEDASPVSAPPAVSPLPPPPQSEAASPVSAPPAVSPLPHKTSSSAPRLQPTLPPVAAPRSGPKVIEWWQWYHH